MKKKISKFIGIMSLIAIVGAGNPMSAMASTENYKNTLYTYQSSEDGNYNTTEWRAKYNSHTNTPYGYVYAISSEGLDSSVAIRKKTKAGENKSASNGYVTVPHMKHTCIRNDFVTSTDATVRLRVRTNTNSGITSGYWSPDCSKAYSYIVG